MISRYLFFSLVFLLFGCKAAKVSDKSVSRPTLVIQKVTDHVYQHTTFLETQSFGNVACNGMIVFDHGEAVVFNTTTTDATSSELINWISDSLKCKVTAIIPTHFHEDCLGGLAEFHRRGIPSFASNQTIALTTLNKLVIPQHGFDQLLELKVGRRSVTAEFPGEGHTRDNIVGYFPSDNVMFGGCLIKELKAGKGNLADANVTNWSKTVTKLKTKYPDARVVIPGHGKSGDTALLDYTIRLFESK